MAGHPENPRTDSSAAPRTMDCDDIQRQIRHGERPEGAGVDRHRAECSGCDALLSDDHAVGEALGRFAKAPLDGPSAELFSSIESAVAKERGVAAWLRSRPTKTRVLLAFSAVLALAAFNLFASSRADLAVYPMLRLLVEVALFAAVIGSSVSIALDALHAPSRPASHRAGLVVFAVAMPFVLTMLPQAHTLHPAALQGAGADFGKRAIACFVMGIGYALPVLLLLRGLDRGQHRASLTVALAAVGAGAAAQLGMHLHCAITFPTHLLLGHATMTLALLALYFGASRLARAR